MQTPMKLETDRYLNISAKVQVDDIDWDEARKVGASDEEHFLLTYFSDIENQTINYMRDLLDTRAALEDDVIGFLSMWNYEEYFHGRALTQYLAECGRPVGDNRIALARRKAQFSEKLEKWGSKALSWIFAEEFPAVHSAWGAMQELTTLRAYEELGRRTPNPALRLLCERIAKQERRHFAWYFNRARELLERSPRAQKLTRFLLSRFWSPVGVGVKTPAEAARLLHTIFRGERANALANELDAKIGTLPGLDGVVLMRGFLARTSNLVPTGLAPAEKSLGEPTAVGH